MSSKTEEYASFSSMEKVLMRKCDVFTDMKGFPNDTAFQHFSIGFKEDEDYYLACVEVDLSEKANKRSRSMGDQALRKFCNVLMNEFFVFRISGNKFNVLCPKEMLGTMKERFDREDEDYTIYYGILEKPYSFRHSIEQVMEGVMRMLQNKQERTIQLQTENLIASRQLTPIELRETETKKYRKTMWYSKITIKVEKPVVSDATIYVFPTKNCEPMVSIPLVGVKDDLTEYHVSYDEHTLQFGVGSIMFTITARFNRDGHMVTMVHNDSDDEKSRCTYHVETVEGICRPLNFGKRIVTDDGTMKEIFPIRQNGHGTFDYILFENGKAVMNTDGLVQMKGKEYEVHMDSESIDLIERTEIG